MTDESVRGDVTPGAQEPRECMPCRGTGSVISNLGGTPSAVTCPWCAGTGVRTAGIDAQAGWAAEAGRAPQESSAAPAPGAADA